MIVTLRTEPVKDIAPQTQWHSPVGGSVDRDKEEETLLVVCETFPLAQFFLTTTTAQTFVIIIQDKLLGLNEQTFWGIYSATNIKDICTSMFVLQ